MQQLYSDAAWAMLLVAVMACGLAAFASAARSSVEPGADECARCFAKNERLTSELEQLAVRVGQLEAELAAQFGNGQGAREGSLLRLNGAFACQINRPREWLPSAANFRTAC